MYIFLDTYDLPKLNQNDKNNLNRYTISSNEIEAVIKSLPMMTKNGAKVGNQIS
jgi:hypothetical protein